MKKFSMRQGVRIVSFTLALIVVLCASTISGYTLANQYKQDLEYSYLRALDELTAYMYNMEVSLTKGMYMNTSTQQHLLCSKLMSESNGAKLALEQLPMGYESLGNVNKFVSQVGDFASSMSTRVSQGWAIGTDDADKFKALCNYARSINLEIQDINSRFGDGELSLSDALAACRDLVDPGGTESLSFVASGFANINNSFSDFPTMIYDGPFSDHISQMTSQFLKDMPEVSTAQAQTNAANFLSVNADSLEYLGDTTNNNLPVYKFRTGNTDLSVTKAGGFVDYTLTTRNVEQASVDFDSANRTAIEFLRRNGMNDMKESYYTLGDGVCTINYAYCKDEIVAYPDLVKVSIALDNGEIIAFDATGYLMNHISRSKPTDIKDLFAVRTNLSPRLKVEKNQLAFIPTAGLNEVLCYEFDCTGENGEKLLVYLNAQSGLEEQIFIVLSSDNGKLVL